MLWGFGAGIAAAFVLAALEFSTALINREFFNMGILSVALLAEIIFFLLAWGVLAPKAPVFHERIWNGINFLMLMALLLYCLPDILLYPTEFVMAGESVFSTDFLFKLIGYLGGLFLIVLTGFALSKVGRSLSFQLVRILLTAGLAIQLANQMAMMVQLLLARRIIPMSKGLFALIKPVINHQEYFLYGVLAVTVALPLVLWRKSLNPQETYANPAQHRKIRAAARRQRRWCTVVLAGYVLAVLNLTVVKAYEEREVVLSPAEPMTISGQEILIPLENISDGHLHRFVYTASDGTEVRFIVIKKNEAAFGVGLDACDICGPTGYYERDDEVVCKLCDVVMNISTIGFKGGCNPVPLAYTLRGGTMVIQTQNLENEKNRFQ
ncbi:hypothetical protein DCMF_23900 [Candidatus Formimonas warabiya]|uniref:Membrane iron-sulfur containing protein FtrD-like domain-containing protein n=1 Tax=Formimonas warabiya TaxID=1761012 RepID=A0A3G1L241_FORW1|nr:hypothetical protein DCMF_23900 [Candidatus Formimonas warabiya]